jgi:AraC-like DNA-binding protein/CheY-like chemotaxis protein
MMALRLGVSAEMLRARFQSLTGYSFRQYLRNIRLSQAADLLRTSRKSIKEIWVAVGYQHFSNFDQDFRAHFGVSPREYRNGYIPQRPSSRRNEKVLIVEDDASTRTTAQRWLQELGWLVGVAETGQAGLLEAFRESPDAVVVDYHLPDCTAEQWLQELVARTQHMPPTVVFTADLEATIPKVPDHPVAILSKLCDIDELATMIDLLVERQHM